MPPPPITLVIVSVCAGSIRKVLATFARVNNRLVEKPLVISSVPALIAMPPAFAPRFADWLMASVPPSILVPPAYVLTPLNTTVPGPLVRRRPAPETLVGSWITPEKIVVPPAAEVSVTPLPMPLFVPRKRLPENVEVEALLPPIVITPVLPDCARRLRETVTAALVSNP